jgi:hypothetical protein
VNGICSDDSQNPAGNGNDNGTQCQAGYILLNGSCQISCPQGFAYQGNECVGTCDTGYTAQNGICTFTSCPADYTEEGTQCVLTSCPSGSTLENGSCVYTGEGETGENQTPPPTIASWEVSPILVKSGNTTTVSWSAENVSNCVASGTNEDIWTGSSGNHPSNPITQQTVYTLTCEGLDGSQISTSSVVNIVPVFEER